MATTFVEYTGDGQASKQFTFPSYQESDVKVRVDGVLKTTSTHYNITGYTTTGGGNVVFTSGNIPSSPANIRIYRDTNVDTAKATFTAGSSVKAADLNNNTTQLLYRAQEEQIPNLIHSYDIDDAAIETAKIKDDAITQAKIANDALTGSNMAAGTITTAKLADSLITTAKLGADSVTNAKIADDSIDSEHYVDGSIDTAHIANDAITADKIANDALTGSNMASGTITTVKLADNAITTAKIAASNVTAAKIATDAITTAKILDGAVTEDKLHTGSVTGVKIADGTVNSAELATGAVTTDKIANNGVTTGKIADANVTTAKIAADAVNGTKIADDSINSEHYVDGSIDTAHIADSQVTTAKIADANITAAKIASNAVTTDKIADGELTTLAGMQSTTASNLASSTALTATTAELNQLDGITLETSVTTNSDTRIPTSKAVNDLVLSVTNALGGFVAIANETSFPTANPDPSNNAGTVVSISQLASGLAVNSSGVATISNGAGTGNTVTITGFPSSLHSQTLPASSGLQVQTTSTLHTYTFHKQLASAADIQAISATVNSFSARYRVSASAPTSSLDGGDLWYDTTNSKLMVYSSQNSAWEESSAIGNFFISTISSSSSTGGGSATPNGTAYRFTISDAPTTAAACIVSVDGVIQKPNSGSSQPSEGFVLVGNDIIFGAAPANGASLFVTVIGSTVGIGTPSNNTVTTAILQNGSVTTAKIVDSNVTTAKIADDAVTNAKIPSDAIHAAQIQTGAVTLTKIGLGAVNDDRLASNAVTTAKIADDAVTAAKLANTSVSAGSYGSSTSIPSITVDAQGRITAASGNTVNTDLVGDTSPQLGGDLDTNSFEIKLDDEHNVVFGNDDDLKIKHSGTNGNINNYTGDLVIRTLGSGDDIFIDSNDDVSIRTHATDNAIKCIGDGAVELYYDSVKQFETLSNGVRLKNGHLQINQNDSMKILLGASDDLQIYHDGTSSFIDTATSHDLFIRNTQGNQIRLQPRSGEDGVKIIADGSVVLYDDNTEMFRTDNHGVTVKKELRINSVSGNGGSTHFNYLDNGNNYITQGDSGQTVFRNASGVERTFIFGNGNWRWKDSYKITLGDSDDLQLYHDGSDSYIENGTGNLNLRVGGENGVRVKPNAAVELYYNNSKTFETISGGIHITGATQSAGHIKPDANNTYDLGTTSLRWRNIYTNDLNLSNEGGANDVDSTWGDWTIQEGESDLFLKNNRSGKKYKFNLTEVL